MKQAILITARCGSTRLAGKHLRDSCGAPILAVLIGRIRHELADEIARGAVAAVIATADEAENRAFERVGGASVFYGAVDNIPLRHLQAAEALDADGVISVDGDDILCSPRAMRAVYNALQRGARYVTTSGLPFGMNASGYATTFLRESMNGHRAQVLETGWGHVFDSAAQTTLRFDDIAADERLRFTLDYAQDFAFFDRLIGELGGGIESASDRAIVDLVLARSLWEINRGVAEEYWNYFRARQQDERERSEAGA